MEEQDIRAKRCTDRINLILEEEQCFMEPIITFIGDKKIDPQIKVFARKLPPTITPAQPMQEAPIEGAS